MQIVPERACDIIVACCVLFNISKLLREPHLDQENDQDADDEGDVDVEGHDVAANLTGDATRAEIISNLFLSVRQ